MVTHLILAVSLLLYWYSDRREVKLRRQLASRFRQITLSTSQWTLDQAASDALVRYAVLSHGGGKDALRRDIFRCNDPVRFV